MVEDWALVFEVTCWQYWRWMNGYIFNNILVDSKLAVFKFHSIANFLCDCSDIIFVLLQGRYCCFIGVGSTLLASLASFGYSCCPNNFRGSSMSVSSFISFFIIL
ncbi:hypothetical protein Peur_031006 [Populus x canadensis]